MHLSPPYIYKTTSYAKRPVNGHGQYYIDTIENYVKYLVNETETDVSLKGSDISMDRLYSSISLAKWLLERNIRCVGTMNNNRVRISVKDVKNRAEFSNTLSKSSGKKNVLLLSTI